MKLAGKGLFSCLVPEQRAPGKGTANPAKEGKLQQGRFRNAPLPLFCQHLVDAEGCERGEVRDDQSGDDIGGFENEGDEIRRWALSQEWLRKDCRAEIECLTSPRRSGWQQY